MVAMAWVLSGLPSMESGISPRPMALTFRSPICRCCILGLRSVAWCTTWCSFSGSAAACVCEPNAPLRRSRTFGIHLDALHTAVVEDRGDGSPSRAAGDRESPSVVQVRRPRRAARWVTRGLLIFGAAGVIAACGTGNGSNLADRASTTTTAVASQTPATQAPLRSTTTDPRRRLTPRPRRECDDDERGAHDHDDRGAHDDHDHARADDHDH